MKQKLLLVVTLFLVVNLTNELKAQIETFKLSDYKLPDLKRQRIDIDFNLNASTSNNNYTGSFSTDATSTNISNDLSARYFLYLNKERYQGEHSINANEGLRIYNYDNENSNKTDEFNNSGNFSIMSDNRFYFNKLFYLGVGIDGLIYYNNNNDEDISYLNEELSTKEYHEDFLETYRLRLPLSIGTGRIERVEDARQSLYIIEALKKNNQLKREPSHAEILQISSAISKIKNKRVLDSRLKKIYELKQIDSVLSALDLLNENDITYFTSLNDMWDYGALHERNAGYRFSFNYEPQILFQKINNKNEEINYLDNISEISHYKNKTFRFYNSLGFQFIWEKPIKQKFQSSFTSSIYYNFYDSNSKEEDLYPEPGTSETDYNIKRLLAGINYRFGIYPNTRTSFYISAHAYGGKKWDRIEDESSEVSKFEDISCSAGISSELSYYFSPKLQLNVTYVLNYNNRENENMQMNDNTKQSLLQNQLIAGLKYSIF